jgi:hypothetical protein
MAGDDGAITLRDDLVEMVKKWTADGTLRFNWPTDNEQNFVATSRQWSDAAALFGYVDPKAEIKAVLQKNEGSAIDAFGEYWRDVPASNLNDLADSFTNVSTALLAISAAIMVYKQAANDALSGLKDDLDDADAWAWTVPDFWEGDHFYDKAVKLIEIFNSEEENLACRPSSRPWPTPPR